MKHIAGWRQWAAGVAALAALVACPLYAAETPQAPEPSDKMSVDGTKDAPKNATSARPHKPSTSAKVDSAQGGDTSVTGVQPGPDSSSTVSGKDAPGKASGKAKSTAAKQPRASAAQDAPR